MISTVSIIIDNIIIKNAYIKKVEVRSGISDYYPSAVIFFSDEFGSVYSKMMFKIGSVVQIVFVDSSNVGNSIYYKSFIINNIYNSFSRDLAKLGGDITVECKHSSEIYQDFTDHIYAGKKISDIIKSVLGTGKKGYSYSDLSDIDDTDDDGTVTRYKINMSEENFIKKNLLRYATIGGQKSYFFVDEMGKPHLKNFKTMMNQNHKISYYLQNPPQNYEDENAPTSDSAGVIYSLSSLIGIYNDKIYKYIYPKECIENFYARTKNTISFNLPPTSYTSESSGTTYGNLFPYSMYTMQKMIDTDYIIHENRNFADRSAMTINEQQSILNRMFALSMTTTYSGHTISAGDTVYICTEVINEETSNQSSVSDTKQQIHWITGRWLVDSIVNTCELGNVTKIYSMINLIKPTLAIDSGTTSLDNYLSFYRVY